MSITIFKKLVLFFFVIASMLLLQNYCIMGMDPEIRDEYNATKKNLRSCIVRAARVCQQCDIECDALKEFRETIGELEFWLKDIRGFATQDCIFQDGETTLTVFAKNCCKKDCERCLELLDYIISTCKVDAFLGKNSIIYCGSAARQKEIVDRLLQAENGEKETFLSIVFKKKLFYILGAALYFFYDSEYKSTCGLSDSFKLSYSDKVAFIKTTNLLPKLLSVLKDTLPSYLESDWETKRCLAGLDEYVLVHFAESMSKFIISQELSNSSLGKDFLVLVRNKLCEAQGKLDADNIVEMYKVQKEKEVWDKLFKKLKCARHKQNDVSKMQRLISAKVRCFADTTFVLKSNKT